MTLMQGAWSALGHFMPCYWILPAVLLLLLPAVCASPDENAAPQGCQDGDWRLAAFHYDVDGVQLDRLAGHVGPGDNFTAVVTLARCDGIRLTFSTDLVVPSCASLIRPQALALVEALDAANISGEARGPLMDDLHSALACPTFHASGSVLAAFVAALGIGAGGGFALYLRRRP